MKKPAEILAEHYLIAAVWADAPEDTNPRLTEQAKTKAKRTAWQFLEIVGPDLIKAVESSHHENGYGSHPDCGTDKPWFAAMGHDLWLTSHGHGVGFWDRDELPEYLRDKLTEYSKRFEHIQIECYRGWVYLHGNDVLSIKG